MTGTRVRWLPAAALDRAAFVLGLISLISPVLSLAGGDFHVVSIRRGGIAVALVLGAAAVAAGLLRRPELAVATGGLFLIAAASQLALLGRTEVLGGSGSTVSLWLGLGTGLVAAGRADRPTPGDPSR